MDTTALNIEQDYRRVIEARFVTKSDKVTPMHCTTCDAVLVMGQAAAAVTADGRWDSYCSNCAALPAAQIRALFARTIALGAEVPAGIQDTVRLFLTNENGATFVAAKRALMSLHDGVARTQRMEALQTDPVFLGLALATTPGLLAERDRTFAESLASQWESKGSLSVKQMPYAIKLGDKARTLDAKGNVAKPWTHEVHVAIEAMGLADGYYAVDHVGAIAHQDTTFVRILTADDGERFMRHIVGGQGETPSGGADWCTKVLDLIAAVGAEASMRRYGREIGRCCKCHRVLTDKPSRDAGIGPVCVLTGF